MLDLTRLEKDFTLTPDNIWVLKDPEAFAYSDGESHEQNLAQIMEQCEDLSVDSMALKTHIKDWVSLYHLSNQRANLLRPFSPWFQGKNILEIGCGCGAITRFLGECGAIVIGVEGSLTRAKIARKRCRDLDNVTIIAATQNDITSLGPFDAVLLIGVLEYSRKFLGENGENQLLSDTYKLLDEQGALFLAIENKLGLKYLAGAPEDHLGLPFVGVQGLYEKDNVVTFGRRELEGLLTKAGYSEPDLYLPFPDYKVPRTVVTPLGWQTYYDQLSGLISETPKQDPQNEINPSFSLELAHKTFWENGLGGDCANSFLFVAYKSHEKCEVIDPDVVAVTYTNDRQRQWNKQNILRQNHQGALTIASSTCEKQPSPLISRDIKHLISENARPYHPGHTLLFEVVCVLNRRNWAYSDLLPIFDDWFKALLAYFKLPSTGLTIDSSIPGIAFDMVPFNTLRQPDRSLLFFDLEWEFQQPLTIGYILYRAIVITLSYVTSTADSLETDLTYYAALNTLFTGLGFKLHDDAIRAYQANEMLTLQSIAMMHQNNIEHPDTPLNIKEITLNPRTYLTKAALMQLKHERDRYQQENQLLWNSTSMKLSQPLRWAKKIILKVRSLLMAPPQIKEVR